MKMNAGVTLMEILVVIIVIGILAAIALPNFTRVREDVIDREAQASLRLMQAAQRIYRMETGLFFPIDHAASIDNSVINADLKLSLPTAANRNWDYDAQIDTGQSTGGTGCVSATNFPGGTKGWYLIVTGTEPLSGLACP